MTQPSPITGAPSGRRYILTLECPNAVGIVAAVASFLADRGFSIEESEQFHDVDNGAFYMRTAFATLDSEHANAPEIEAGFAPIARRFQMIWALHDADARPKILIAVSNQGHCLYDLVHRVESGWLRCEIAGVISNHETFRGFVEKNAIPFHHIPVAPDDKPAAEQAMFDRFEAAGAEFLVLARYMQVLTREACQRLDGRCVNIHHSFLPSFKGAQPYAQAHARGVKIIGATAHFVTADLDEGPIIEQGVARISHRHSVKDLIDIGRDLECQVLARAVRWRLERRVVMAKGKTVVFA